MDIDERDSEAVKSGVHVFYHSTLIKLIGNSRRTWNAWPAAIRLCHNCALRRRSSEQYSCTSILQSLFPDKMERACELCLKNCLRLHGAEEGEAAKSCLICVLWRSEGVKSDQTDRHPSFLKKITESTMSTLELPTSFVRDYIGSLHESVILEGPSSKQWRVELHGYGEGFNISFGQGWNNFAVDHGLQIGDQLSFSLSKKSYFQVEVRYLYWIATYIVLGFCFFALLDDEFSMSFVTVA